MCTRSFPFHPTELPPPATVYSADGIKVQLFFEAEFSNVLIVNARVAGNESAEACVGFEMPKVSVSTIAFLTPVIIFSEDICHMFLF